MSDPWAGTPDTDKFWAKEARELDALPTVPTLGQSAEEHNARWAASTSYRRGEAIRAALFFEGVRAAHLTLSVRRSLARRS